jgi:hypothetical protein
MSFRVAIGSTHCASFSINGVPYMWQSGDVTTISSNENKITASDGAASDEFGLNVAVGCGRIVVGAPILMMMMDLLLDQHTFLT